MDILLFLPFHRGLDRELSLLNQTMMNSVLVASILVRQKKTFDYSHKARLTNLG